MDMMHLLYISLTFTFFQLQSFHICAQKGEDNTRLVLCDVMGLGDGEMTGLTLHDILSVIKGHVPEGHKVRGLILNFLVYENILLKVSMGIM